MAHIFTAGWRLFSSFGGLIAAERTVMVQDGSKIFWEASEPAFAAPEAEAGKKKQSPPADTPAASGHNSQQPR